MERISIKNVHFSEALSEETNAYTADIYLDNKKFGYAKNDGQGGQTNIMPYPNKRELFNEANEYTQSLGETDFGGFKMQATLDAVADYLLEKNIEAKLLKKAMTKGLVYKEKNSINVIKFNMSLKKVLAHSQGHKTIRRIVLGLRRDGHKVLNTNIPQELLK